MTGTKDLPENTTSLPDQIAAAAGMPLDRGADHSLHQVHDPIARSAEAEAELARARLDDVREAIEAEARKATDGASHLRDRAADTINETRERWRETADDVRERAAGAYDDARDWASERYEHHRRRASDLADRGYDRVYRARSATEEFVADNPLLVGVVGLAAGLLLGALLPRTRQENATLGPWADEVRDQGLRYARDATRQGRAFVERALDPDNLDAAVRRTEDEAHRYEGSERTAHRL